MFIDLLLEKEAEEERKQKEEEEMRARSEEKQRALDEAAQKQREREAEIEEKLRQQQIAAGSRYDVLPVKGAHYCWLSLFVSLLVLYLN